MYSRQRAPGKRNFWTNFVSTASPTTIDALGLGRACEYTFHDLRRSFIHDEMDRLIEKGHSKEEVAKIVAKMVGHNRTEVLRWYGQW